LIFWLSIEYLKTMIQLDKVAKVYRQDHQEVIALSEINLTIAKGEFLAIMGPSGSGKSTLLNVIGGLDQPTSGTVTVDGRSISSLSDNEMTHLRRKTISMIFQFFNLLPHLSVWENVALPLLLRGDPAAGVKRNVETNLKAVGLSRRLRHRPHELSGGEQQRVAIARSLVISPKVLLADEPTGNLDSGVGRSILDLIKTLSDQQSITVILATHSQQAASYANRIIRLKDGMISQ
jgi:putative ABC transport system ATP-binding protein